MCVVQITSNNGHVICQVQICLAFMPPILGATPPETTFRPSLLIIRVVVKYQPLLPSCGHEYVNWNNIILVIVAMFKFM